MTKPPATPPAAQTREPGWYWAVPNAGFEERPYEYDAGMWWWDGHPHDESEMQKIGPRIPTPAERPGDAALAEAIAWAKTMAHCIDQDGGKMRTTLCRPDKESLRLLADAALTPSAPGGGTGWRDISTAPRDGTRLILGWDDISSLPMHCEMGRFRSGTGPGSGWCNTYGHSFSASPTHYMPLPSPPGAAEEGGR